MNPTQTNDEKLTEKLRANCAALQLVSRKTAAGLLDVHPNFVDELCKRGDIKAVHLGARCKRITLTSINQFLSGHA